MNVVQLIRTNGKCPPSLLPDEPSEASFETAAGKVLDPNALMLSTGSDIVNDFNSLMQMASSTTKISDDPEKQRILLVRRRCIVLSIVGSTPPSSSSMSAVLQSGFLSIVKTWLAETLNGAVGGVDFLLHLLTNITNLPVTKSVVKDSAMGKAIGSVEKHSICIGSPNETAIKERVKNIKDAWNKSVKALKNVAKRESDSSEPSSPPAAKRPRVDETKKASFSTLSLLKKLKTDGETPSGTPSTAGMENVQAASDQNMKLADSSNGDAKTLKRVKWQDHFGGKLEAKRTTDGIDVEGDDSTAKTHSSFDSKQRDRLREKELLARVKKSKLMDDDDDGILGMERSAPGPSIQPSTQWKAPPRLAERTDAPSPQVDSKEVAIQTARMTSVSRAQYSSEYSVPSSPAPMSDVEQALDMTHQSSTTTQSIPFFVPQQVPEPVPAAPAPVPAFSQLGNGAVNGWQQTNLLPNSGSNVATPAFVQSLGLPPFLVGQDVQALQTLADTPSLLSTFVDSNGMYDQARLTSLVQTLSKNSAPVNQAGTMGVPGTTNPYGASAGQQTYGASSGSAGGIYGPASGNAYGAAANNSGFGNSGWQPGNKHDNRGGQSNDDGNLHISGYGPTTSQAEIIALFAPYVQVNEVVMKGTFSFVNTSDPPGAQRAREALSGALLGGAPIRINMAQRRKRNDGPPAFSGNNGYYGGAGQANTSFKPAAGQPFQQPGPAAGGDMSNVRDDRGNPATKNLFVAGYGPNTSEHQIKELFSQHAQIIGIIMKGTFSFVNTSDKNAAIRAREMLSGTMLNGGVLRINFAKESGRLGTSFDVTYNNVGGGGGGGGPPGGHSHYGRF